MSHVLPLKKYKIYNLNLFFLFDLENILKGTIKNFSLSFQELGYVRIEGEFLYYPVKISTVDALKVMRKMNFIPLFRYSKNMNFINSDIKELKSYVHEYLKLNVIKETSDDNVKKYLNKYKINFTDEDGILILNDKNIIITKHDPSSLPKIYNNYNIIYPLYRELRECSLIENYIEIIGYFIKNDGIMILNNTEQHLAIYKNNKFIDYLY